MELSETSTEPDGTSTEPAGSSYVREPGPPSYREQTPATAAASSSAGDRPGPAWEWATFGVGARNRQGCRGPAFLVRIARPA